MTTFIKMQLGVKRYDYGENKDYTLGKFTVNGEDFAYSLEDKYRDLSKEEKVYGKTAIPCGTYKVIMKQSPKFKRVMPYLVDVPHFTNIMIHPGNTVEDSEGCILVGKKSGQPNVIMESRATSDRLNELISKAIEAGEEVTIKVELS